MVHRPHPAILTAIVLSTILCPVLAIPGRAPAAVASPATVQTITLNFPADYSVGKIYLLDATYPGFLAREHISHTMVDARGIRTFKRGDKIALMSSYALSEHMEVLDRLPPDSLVHLDLRRLELNSKELIHLRNLRSLQQLDLQNTDVDDGCLQYLTGLVNLKSLGLSKTLITGRTLAALLPVKDMQRLDIGRNPLDEKSLEVLPQFKNLLVLSMEECGLTDGGMKNIGNISSLAILMIGENRKITDRGLTELLRLKKLRFLNLVGLPLTDRGLAVIARLPLKELTFKANQLTGVQLHKLRRLMPGTEIKILDISSMPADLFGPVHKMQ